VRVAALTPWTRRNFVRWMFEDSPRGLLFTPDRWRRGALSAPGAFADG
jgi:menaquinone-9 beta-reductase